MKKIFKASASRGGLQLRDTDVRSPQKGEVLLKIKTASICGTDVHIYEWNSWAQRLYAEKLPLSMGHEFCGEVVEVGIGVEGFSSGDRVCVETHLPCGCCWQCKQGRSHICENLQLFSKSNSGCFSEYSTVPVGYLVKVPDWLSDEQSALLEPFGVAVRAAQAAEVSGKTVLIQGCGPIGLLAIPTVKALGALQVFAVETEPYRIELAKRMGVDVILNPKEEDVIRKIKVLTEGAGVGCILECTGNITAIEVGLECIAKGCNYIFTGLPSKNLSLDVSRYLISREIFFKGCYGRLIPQTWSLAFHLLKTKKCDIMQIVTHQFGLNDYEKAFEVSVTKQSGKVLFKNT